MNISMVMVWPKDEATRKVLRHPTAGGFMNMQDPAPWPMDQFTLRRLADGSVTRAGPDSPAAEKP